jgi:hypothetical protein
VGFRVLYWNFTVLLGRDEMVYLEPVRQQGNVLVFVELGRGSDLNEVWEQMGFTASGLQMRMVDHLKEQAKGGYICIGQE